MQTLTNSLLVVLVVLSSFTLMLIPTGVSALENCTEKKLRDLQIAIIDCSDEQTSTYSCAEQSIAKLSDKTIYVLGDSILKITRQNVTSAFTEAGALNINIDGADSRVIGSTSDPKTGLEILSNSPYLASSNKIVIELGSYGGLTQNDITSAINLIKATKPSADIYWVNIGVNNDFRDSPLDVGAYNDLLNSNQSVGYKVIDWASVIQSNPSYINPDPTNGLGINPTAEGSVAFANLLTKSIGLSSSCNANLIGGDNQEMAFNFLVENGYTPEQSAGIIANMIAESKVEPMRLEGTKSGEETPSDTLGIKLRNRNVGWGIVQWSPPSKMILTSLDAGISNGEIDTLEFQLQFLVGQLQNTGIGASLPETRANNRLLKTVTAEEATTSFAVNYERCTTCQAGTANVRNRVSFAIDVLAKYGS